MSRNQGSLANGQVVTKQRKSGKAYAIRFRADGHRRYEHLGYDYEGWNRKRAETELQNVLADVRRGIWQPRRPDPEPVQQEDPTFHEFASEWFETTKVGKCPIWKMNHHRLA